MDFGVEKEGNSEKDEGEDEKLVGSEKAVAEVIKRIKKDGSKN